MSRRGDRAELLRDLAWHPRGFKLLVELLARGHVRAVQEVPYVFCDRSAGSSKLGPTALWRFSLQVVRFYGFRLATDWRSGWRRRRSPASTARGPTR